MKNETREISEKSSMLWAKTSRDTGLDWLPIHVHMRDSTFVCSVLWDDWIPANTKKRIVDGIRINSENIDMEYARKLCTFISGIHDVGKATPAFQSRRIQGNDELTEIFRNNLNMNNLPFRTDLNDPGAIPHSLASELILERQGIDRSIAVIPGGHHGRTPTRKELRVLADSYPDNTGFKNSEWCKTQNELIDYCARTCRIGLNELKSTTADVESQVLMTGIVVISDWIASNESIFPLVKEPLDDEGFEKRMKSARPAIVLPPRWIAGPSSECNLFSSRFPYDPRPFQRSVESAAVSMKEPGIMILEAPMGEGKTEAALIAAEIMMRHFGLGGIMFALPTQATADGLFPRIREWIRSASSGKDGFHTVFLAHGKSKFNTDYNALRHMGFGNSNVDIHEGVVHDWFTGKRKGILSDFVIGTVDQVLMMGLKQKHAEMRHLGLSGKVVIIDECHAYDAYMGSYLCRALAWLGSYRVPTILLSATLPPGRRDTLIGAYTNSEKPSIEDRGHPYPCISFTGNGNVVTMAPDPSNRSMIVSITRIRDDELVSRIVDASAKGGYIGVIVNTIGRAQRLVSMLSELIPPEDIRLLHSGFTSMDRSSHESEVMELMRPPHRHPVPFRMIVVGTQVMEQSLDLDFDLLFTDLCPIDLLLQRIGRLHRHPNTRPPGMEEPVCFVIDDAGSGFDKGTEAVYGRYQLYNTRILLKDSISIPDDIPRLVDAAYSEDGLEPPDPIADDYRRSKDEQQRETMDKDRRATAFQIADPTRMRDLVGWLDNPIVDGDDGEKAVASVRDGDRSVEAILVQRIDGRLHVLPWIPKYGGSAIPVDRAPDPEMAFYVSGCRAPLPRRIVSIGVERVIDDLRHSNYDDIPIEWSESEWLNGELFVVLDDDLQAEIGGRMIRYDEKMGMMILDR